MCVFAFWSHALRFVYVCVRVSRCTVTESPAPVVLWNHALRFVYVCVCACVQMHCDVETSSRRFVDPRLFVFQEPLLPCVRDSHPSTVGFQILPLAFVVPVFQFRPSHALEKRELSSPQDASCMETHTTNCPIQHLLFIDCCCTPHPHTWHVVLFRSCHACHLCVCSSASSFAWRAQLPTWWMSAMEF